MCSFSGGLKLLRAIVVIIICLVSGELTSSSTTSSWEGRRSVMSWVKMAMRQQRMQMERSSGEGGRSEWEESGTWSAESQECPQWGQE